MEKDRMLSKCAVRHGIVWGKREFSGKTFLINETVMRVSHMERTQGSFTGKNVLLLLFSGKCVFFWGWVGLVLRHPWRYESKTSLWAIRTGDHEVAWFVGDGKPHPLNLNLLQPLPHTFGLRKTTDLDKTFFQLYSILYSHRHPSGMARHVQTPAGKKHSVCGM